MKRIFYLILALPLFISSCESTPESYFTADTIEPEVGQKILFNNESHNASKYEWDFGDGFVSNEANPVHIYTGTGTYTVVLIVTSKNGQEDESSLTVTVMIPTLLEIEVLEWGTYKTIAGASIILYPSISNWEAQTNKAVEGFTDSDGVTVFSGLNPIVYYVDVWEATHDNYQLASEDVGFIRTPEILPHKINRFVAWVDIVQHTKGTARTTRDVIVKKIERKAIDIELPVIKTDSDNWQDLLNRSIKIN